MMVSLNIEEVDCLGHFAKARGKFFLKTEMDINQNASEIPHEC